MIGLTHYLTVASALFVIGIFGIFLNRKNVIVILMSIELILLSVNINFVAFSAHLGDLGGQVFTMFILTVAAAEAAIGLAILALGIGYMLLARRWLGSDKHGPAVEPRHTLADLARDYRLDERERRLRVLPGSILIGIGVLIWAFVIGTPTAWIVFAIVAALVPMGLLAGLVFVLALAGYIFAAFWQERGLAAGALDDAHGAAFDKSLALQEADPALKAPSEIGRSAFLSILIAIAGLALVVLGGNFLVSGAVGLARSFSILDTIIGLTIVAIGTSMPELVTSVMAALRKQTEVAFGNVVGSNIYNILGIGGFTALISPTNVPSEIVRFDNLIMIGASLVLVAFAFTGRRISRREGAVLVAGYAAYVALIWP